MALRILAGYFWHQVSGFIMIYQSTVNARDGEKDFVARLKYPSTFCITVIKYTFQ